MVLTLKIDLQLHKIMKTIPEPGRSKISVNDMLSIRPSERVVFVVSGHAANNALQV